VEAVKSVQIKGQVCILDIDVQGVRNVKTSSLNPYYIFIAPPSMNDLEARLRGRGTEEEEDIEKRLANARDEIDYGEEDGNFDKFLVNDNLDRASADLCATVTSWFPHLQEAADDDDGDCDEEEVEMEAEVEEEPDSPLQEDSPTEENSAGEDVSSD